MALNRLVRLGISGPRVISRKVIEEIIIRRTMMRAAQHEVGGGPEKISIGQVNIPKISSNEVLIKVFSSAINRADISQRMGKYPIPEGSSEILGLEGAGTVEAVGESCRKWKVGERVMALLNGGGNAEFASVHEEHVMHVPRGLSYAQAASIPEVWLTAFQLLHFIGKVQKGENVLVHAAGSGVGLAAIQLAKYAGAKVFATAGCDKKLAAALAAGASSSFNYKTDDFSQRILELTQGKGVDVILDCVGGSFWEKNCDAIAVDGRWVLYGALGGSTVNGDILGRILRKRVRLEASTLRSRSDEYKSVLVKAFSEHALAGFADGTFYTVIDSEFPLGKLGEAHRYMEANLNTGKIVIRIRSDEDGDSKDEL